MTTTTEGAALDRAHLLAVTGGDLELASEILEIFREQAAIWARMLDPQVGQAAWADAAHTLKGAALGAGAMRLGAACDAVERAARSAEPMSRAQAGVLLSAVKDELGDALEATARAIYEIADSGALRAS